MLKAKFFTAPTCKGKADTSLLREILLTSFKQCECLLLEFSIAVGREILKEFVDFLISKSFHF